MSGRNLFRHFPREVDMNTRKVVKNREGLQKFINAMNGKENITTTVYGFRELKPNGTRAEYITAVIPHFVVDMDRNRAEEKLGMTEDEAGDRCSQEAWRLSMHLLENKIKHAIWFTGGGFHIWVMLDKEYALPPKEANELLFSGRTLINKWVRDMDLVTLDPVVSFRPDRHIRIPNSFNFKRNLWTIPLFPGSLGDKWSFYEQMAQEPKLVFTSSVRRAWRLKSSSVTQTTTSLFPIPMCNSTLKTFKLRWSGFKTSLSCPV